MQATLSTHKPSTTRVVIADDQALIIEGVTSVLGAYSARTIEVIGTVGSFSELLQRLPELDPEILILDLADMGDIGAMTLIERLRRDYSRMQIIILSSDVSLAPELLKAGAKGYVSKGEPPHLVLEAIIVVVSGHQYISPSVQAYLERWQNSSGSKTLTPQQLLIVKLLKQKLDTDTVATQLQISRETVLNHITQAKQRTGSETRYDLIEWYQRCYGDTKESSA